MKPLLKKIFHVISLVALILLVAALPALAFSDSAIAAPAAVASVSLQAKVLAIAFGVYSILQVVKKALESFAGVHIPGAVAFALNIGLAIGGVITVVQPAELFSIPTLIAVLSAAAGAAGFHGTVSKAVGN